MAEERKRFLKEKILSDIKDFIEYSDSSLEELEDISEHLNNIMCHMDDLATLQEKLNDK